MLRCSNDDFLQLISWRSKGWVSLSRAVHYADDLYSPHFYGFDNRGYTIVCVVALSLHLHTTPSTHLVFTADNNNNEPQQPPATVPRATTPNASFLEAYKGGFVGSLPRKRNPPKRRVSAVERLGVKSPPPPGKGIDGLIRGIQQHSLKVLILLFCILSNC